jgi:GxxExxY protein
MIHEEITRDIIGAGMAVLNELRPGLDEKLYERVLIIELSSRGHSFEQQREFPVYYRKAFIGKLVPDPLWIQRS